MILLMMYSWRFGNVRYSDLLCPSTYLYYAYELLYNHISLDFLLSPSPCHICIPYLFSCFGVLATTSILFSAYSAGWHRAQSVKTYKIKLILDGKSPLPWEWDTVEDRTEIMSFPHVRPAKACGIKGRRCHLMPHIH